MKKSFFASLLTLLLVFAITIGFFANVEAQSTSANKTKPAKEKTLKSATGQKAAKATHYVIGCGVFKIKSVLDTSRQICIAGEIGGIRVWSNAVDGEKMITAEWQGEFDRYDAKVSVEFLDTDEKLPLGMLDLLNNRKVNFHAKYVMTGENENTRVIIREIKIEVYPDF
ncbi:MAG: hypothetical protein Q7R98_03570 [Candidatus Jorgensenbacteria bacterium]|nr:hypothetical protein [Candidatus Jorgensenbacteria bacterium]